MEYRKLVHCFIKEQQNKKIILNENAIKIPCFLNGNTT